jgi:hypothetical protein
MRRTFIIVATLLATGGCAAGTKPDDTTASSMSAIDGTPAERVMKDEVEVSKQAGKRTHSDPPSKEVKPSPWQPPAEVDPILPPVEGDEPK